MADPSDKKNEGKRKPWCFMDRWRIEGCLFTESPLHIGSGLVIPHPSVLVDGKPAEVAAVMKDHAGWPILPGASVKGSVRAWVESCSAAAKAERIRSVFGRPIDTGTLSGQTDENPLTEGGRAVFHDAPLKVLRNGETPLPFWNSCRHTYISANNSIDRHTRTAADKHLIYTECVPAGVGFDVTITGNFSEQDAGFIVYALDGFNDEQSPILIGADTENGKGRCRWEQGRVYHMDKKAAVRWMKNENRGLAEKEMPELSSKELAALRIFFNEKPGEDPQDHYRFDIILSFESHFLVNDPPLKAKAGEKNNSSEPDIRPLVDEMNRVILPAKSFRGAFRSQAEKILRTLDISCCDISRPCKGITKTNDWKQKDGKENLCEACKIFGAAGWASLLSVSDFKLIPGDYEFTDQEFVAIDRFTGGGRDGAKFKARAIYKPQFEGTIELDGKRLSKIQSLDKDLPKRALALLALTLRDLKEGDITFGFGAAKGYGKCTWRTEGTFWENEGFQKSVCDSMKALFDLIPKTKKPEEAAAQVAREEVK